MERIKRFLLDETATAEATSTVLMVAAVGTALALGLYAYYDGLNTFFGGIGTKASTAGELFSFTAQ